MLTEFHVYRIVSFTMTLHEPCCVDVSIPSGFLAICVVYWERFHVLKTPGLFPITSKGSFSLPSEFAPTMTVILSLLYFPPWQDLFLNASVLLGRRRKNEPVSSVLNTLLGLYPSRTERRVVDSQALTISSLTEAFSPHTFGRYLVEF